MYKLYNVHVTNCTKGILCNLHMHIQSTICTYHYVLHCTTYILTNNFNYNATEWLTICNCTVQIITIKLYLHVDLDLDIKIV